MRLRLLSFCFVISILSLACYQVPGLSGSMEEESMPSSTLENERYLWISAGTMGSFGQLEVGVSNLIIQEYEDENGDLVEGPTLALSLIVPGESVVTIRAHTGQIIEIGDYALRVIEIDDSKKPTRIHLGFSELE